MMSEGLKILSEWDWCRNQPPLFEGEGYLPPDRWRNWWENSKTPPEHLEANTKRLGHHYEDLLNEAFLQNTNLSIRRNLQIIEESKTLGEVDFLLKENHRCLHLEVSIKFYLHCPRRNQLISPSGKENWDGKREKLFGHQIPLGKKYFEEIDESIVWVQGMIGYHPNAKLEGKAIPNLTANHPKCHWVYASEFFELTGEKFSTGGFLAQHHRDRWGRMPVERKIDDSTLSQVIQDIQKGDRPYAWLAEEGSGEVWVVVNENW